MDKWDKQNEAFLLKASMLGIEVETMKTPKGYNLIKYRTNDETVNIPSYINHIDRFALIGSHRIKRLILPDLLEGRLYLELSDTLESINIPSKISTILNLPNVGHRFNVELSGRQKLIDILTFRNCKDLNIINSHLISHLHKLAISCSNIEELRLVYSKIDRNAINTSNINTLYISEYTEISKYSFVEVHIENMYCFAEDLVRAEKLLADIHDQCWFKRSTVDKIAPIIRPDLRNCLGIV